MADPVWKVTYQSLTTALADHIPHTQTVIQWHEAGGVAGIWSWAQAHQSDLDFTSVIISIESNRPVSETPQKYFIVEIRAPKSEDKPHVYALKYYDIHANVNVVHNKAHENAVLIGFHPSYSLNIEEELGAA
jgi:hypothetical protein